MSPTKTKAPEPAAADPEPTFERKLIPLERGAVLFLHERASGRCSWSVRWPSPKEKDAELAAGGWRNGDAENVEEAEAAGRAAFREGPARLEA